LFGNVTAGDDDGTGLIVLGPDNTVEMANDAADRFLDELDTRDTDGHLLPTAVRSVAARTRRTVLDGRDTGVARARVLTGRGRWVVVRGTLLDDVDGDDPRVAVLLEAARPPELVPLIADAYGFTERERRVTELVAHGFSTSEIALRLHLSQYTVQDHLKAIFEKSGTSARGDLVARLFFDQYAPQLSTPAVLPPDPPTRRSSN
jgi:DNA-binding NarL/FixJ family response regulator